jgi:two-component SAPR family response regulator
MRILIIDDELLIVKAISVVLERAGHKIVGAGAAVPRALELIDTVEADLALVDFNLQGVRAEPVVERLRERGIFTIIMSGYTTDQLPEGMRSVRFISKPIALDDLLKEIGNVHT